MPERVRLSRARGWRLPDNAVVVSRPSRWGNPFVVGKHGTRVQCAALFAQLARGFIDLGGSLTIEEQLTMYRRLRRHVSDLNGRDLACWCPLDGGACHGDVLLLLANPEHPMPAWMRQPVDIGRVRLGMAAPDLEKLNRAHARKQREGIDHGTSQES